MSNYIFKETNVTEYIFKYLYDLDDKGYSNTCCYITCIIYVTNK